MFMSSFIIISLNFTSLDIKITSIKSLVGMQFVQSKTIERRQVCIYPEIYKVFMAE